VRANQQRASVAAPLNDSSATTCSNSERSVMSPGAPLPSDAAHRRTVAVYAQRHSWHARSNRQNAACAANARSDAKPAAQNRRE